MGYVAIKGGEEAIKYSLAFYRNELKKDGLKFAIDKVISEGSLYTKKLARVAIKKSAGDLLNAAFFIRAHRSSCQRIGIASAINIEDLRLCRRISSAFKDIQGGQILGASNDYEVKLILDKKEKKTSLKGFSKESIYLKSALHPLREENLVKTLPFEKTPWDITRTFPQSPYPRSAVLQVMSRGEGGSMLGFAYTTMQGYGDVHPTIADLRLGMGEVKFRHPFIDQEVKIGEIEVTACEAAGAFNKMENGEVKLTTGFGFCFGFHETKAISMAILDLSLYNNAYTIGDKSIASDFEMIMHHLDGIESQGFTNHYKLPHYVTFQADLQVFARAKAHTQKDNA